MEYNIDFTNLNKCMNKIILRAGTKDFTSKS